MMRCMKEAFEYFEGLPKTAFTDCMKSVFLEMEVEVPRWNPRFADCRGAKPWKKPISSFNLQTLKMGHCRVPLLTSNEDIAKNGDSSHVTNPGKA
jgi:hypothetical protein